MTEDNKKSLTAFILSIVALNVSCAWIIGGIAGIVLGILALNFRNAGIATQENPYRVFNKITLPVSIVSIVLSAIFFIIWIFVSVAAALA